MATLVVDGIEVPIGPDDNVLLSARKAGVEIPHYCWHPALSVVASCRMCLVEVGEHKSDGTVAFGPKLVPSCQTPSMPGIVVRTNSPKVQQARAATLEYFLLNHPLDCPVCDKAGECYLQDYSYKFGRAHSRLNEPKVLRPDKDNIGDQITLFTDRCVLCTRCVRFTREISGTAELYVTKRGAVEEIDVFPGKPCNNKLAGNVVDLCPVGALCSKDFLYRERVWWLKSQSSVCPRCSTGCSIHVDQNNDQIHRLRPRENPLAQGHFMCDEGRFGFRHVHDARRLTGPWIGRGGAAGRGVESSTDGKGPSLSKAPATDGELDIASVDPWPAVLAETRRQLERLLRADDGRFVGVFSPFMTCEEAYLLANLLRCYSPEARFALGRVPLAGDDDSYPKGPRGEEPADEAVRFTIRAEKCPNRKGVEAVLRHFAGDFLEFDQVLQVARGGGWSGVYLVGGYPDAWISDDEAALLASAECLIVQDYLASPASQHADIVLAGGSFAERDGTYVNHAGVAQAIRRAILSPVDARPDGRILMDLAQRAGLFHAPSLRKEMAAAIPTLQPLEVGDLGEHGVRLESLPADRVHHHTMAR